MATQTTNLSLVKPTYSEPTDISVINGNMDIIDGVVGGTAMGTTATTLTGAIAEHEGDISGISTEMGKVEDSIAIVVNGDTAPQNITSGQYLFIKNHSTLSSGGYHATAAISSGADITSSNVAADADGIANSLYDSIANMGVLLYEGNISPTSTNVSITNLSKYRFFLATMNSSWDSGVAFGKKMSSTNYRFVGISGSQNSGAVTSILKFTVSGDTVTSVAGSLGTSATGVSSIYGIL